MSVMSCEKGREWQGHLRTSDDISAFREKLRRSHTGSAPILQLRQLLFQHGDRGVVGPGIAVALPQHKDAGECIRERRERERESPRISDLMDRLVKTPKP